MGSIRDEIRQTKPFDSRRTTRPWSPLSATADRVRAALARVTEAHDITPASEYNVLRISVAPARRAFPPWRSPRG